MEITKHWRRRNFFKNRTEIPIQELCELPLPDSFWTDHYKKIDWEELMAVSKEKTVYVLKNILKTDSDSISTRYLQSLFEEHKEVAVLVAKDSELFKAVYHRSVYIFSVLCKLLFEKGWICFSDISEFVLSNTAIIDLFTTRQFMLSETETDVFFYKMAEKHLLYETRLLSFIRTYRLSEKVIQLLLDSGSWFYSILGYDLYHHDLIINTLVSNQKIADEVLKNLHTEGRLQFSTYTVSSSITQYYNESELYFRIMLDLANDTRDRNYILRCVSCYYRGDDEFWENNEELIQWKSFSENTSISEKIFRLYADRMDWKIASRHYPFTRDMIRDFSDRIDWNQLRKNPHVSKEDYKEFEDEMEGAKQIQLSQKELDFLIEHLDIACMEDPDFNKISEKIKEKIRRKKVKK